MIDIKNLTPSRLISAFPDEAPSSWLVRLANANYLNIKTFCGTFEMSETLKSEIDISPVISSPIFSTSDIKLPIGLKDKIADFTWKSRTSDWIINPNKKGHAHWNCFSKICPQCLTEYGYYRNSWKLQLFQGCTRCELVLIDNCPNCKMVPSAIKSDLNTNLVKNYNPLNYCWYCNYDYRILKANRMDPYLLERMNKIEKAYTEDPPNIRYLKFLQFGYVEELIYQKSSKS